MRFFGHWGWVGVGAYTRWDFPFSFVNGIPYMAESDKKRTPSSGLSILGVAWGSSQWALLGRLLRGTQELRFCSLRL